MLKKRFRVGSQVKRALNAWISRERWFKQRSRPKRLLKKINKRKKKVILKRFNKPFKNHPSNKYKKERVSYVNKPWNRYKKRGSTTAVLDRRLFPKTEKKRLRNTAVIKVGFPWVRLLSKKLLTKKGTNRFFKNRVKLFKLQGSVYRQSVLSKWSIVQTGHFKKRYLNFYPPNRLLLIKKPVLKIRKFKFKKNTQPQKNTHFRFRWLRKFQNRNKKSFQYTLTSRRVKWWRLVKNQWLKRQIRALGRWRILLLKKLFRFQINQNWFFKQRKLVQALTEPNNRFLYSYLLNKLENERFRNKCFRQFTKRRIKMRYRFRYRRKRRRLRLRKWNFRIERVYVRNRRKRTTRVKFVRVLEMKTFKRRRTYWQNLIRVKRNPDKKRYFLFFKRSRYNIFVTLTDVRGNVLISRSAGNCKIFDKKRKRSRDTLRSVIRSVAAFAHNRKIDYIYTLFISYRYRWDQRVVFRQMFLKGVQVLSIRGLVNKTHSLPMPVRKIKRR